jgi:hypothetical protein
MNNVEYIKFASNLNNNNMGLNDDQQSELITKLETIVTDILSHERGLKKYFKPDVELPPGVNFLVMSICINIIKDINSDQADTIINSENNQNRFTVDISNIFNKDIRDLIDKLTDKGIRGGFA